MASIILVTHTTSENGLPMTTTASTYQTDYLPLPHRPFGKTGQRVPLLGLGTAPGGTGLKDEEAIRLFNRAIDLGVTYVDTAPMYGRAQRQLSEIVPERREEMFLVSKALTEDGAEAQRILEDNLRELKTDYLDLMFVHSVGSHDVGKVLSPTGSLAALRSAKQQGLVRHIGVTAHNNPWKVLRVLEESDIDVLMIALNFADHFTYGFDGEVLSLARQKDVAVAAMKVYGGATGMKYEKPIASAMQTDGFTDYERALRYALGLPGVGTAVVGVFSEEELEQNIQWVRRYQPLTVEEEESLRSQGQQIARQWGPHFGPVDASE